MMHTMMNNTGTGFEFGLTALWGVHMLSIILLTVGIVFLVLWAARTLNHAQLKNWGIGLVVGAAIACLLTIGARGATWNIHGMGNTGGNHMMQNGQRDDDRGMMNMGHDMMDMSMGDMSSMLEGKTGDAFDKAFIEGMIPHHQGAIDMARAALQSAKHDEIKRMARDIISAQQSEIDMMKQWQKDWGYNQ